jgi:hypothetical protein
MGDDVAERDRDHGVGEQARFGQRQASARITNEAVIATAAPASA